MKRGKSLVVTNESDKMGFLKIEEAKRIRMFRISVLGVFLFISLFLTGMFYLPVLCCSAGAALF